MQKGHSTEDEEEEDISVENKQPEEIGKPLHANLTATETKVSKDKKRGKEQIVLKFHDIIHLYSFYNFPPVTMCNKPTIVAIDFLSELGLEKGEEEPDSWDSEVETDRKSVV